MFFRLCLNLMVACAWRIAPALAQEQENTEHCWNELRVDVFEWVCAEEVGQSESSGKLIRPIVLQSRRALLVTEAGHSEAIGERLALDIRKRFGDTPLWVLNAQPRLDAIRGSTGFMRGASKGQGRWGSPDRMVAGAITARVLSQLLKSEGTNDLVNSMPRKVLPSVSGSLSILGAEWSGFRYQLHKNLMTEESLVISSKDYRVRWFGSLISHELVPDLSAGQINARIEFLAKTMKGLTDNWLLVGSSGRFDAAKIQLNLDYFVNLQIAVIEARALREAESDLIQKLSVQLMSEHPDLPARLLEVHQLNVQRVWRQMKDLGLF